MNHSKNNLLKALHTVLSKNVLGEKQYISRFKGFVGELNFHEWVRQNRDISNFFTGGYFIPKLPKSRSIINPIYFTVSSDHPDRYIKIYDSLSKLPCEHLYFIQWDKNIPFDQWHISEQILFNESLKTPKINVFQYDPTTHHFHKTSLETFLNHFPSRVNTIQPQQISQSIVNLWQEKLVGFAFESLLDLYVQRLIFDGYIGYSRVHGIPSDIDAIAYKPDTQSYTLIEVKEKDLSKMHPQGFGMDISRIKDLTDLSTATGLAISYVVKRIDNQKDRNFLEWKIISLQNFINHLQDRTIQGGSGMGFENGHYPTQICPYQYFKDLK